MATYVPNATQTTEPVESRTVESAALEFRTLKESVNTRIAALTADFDALEAVVTAEDAKDLRVPEAAVAPLPAIAARAGKVLAFDAGGDPTVLVVGESADSSLRTDLAASSGSSLVGYDGGTVQDVLDGLTGPSGAASVGYTPSGTGAVATTVKQVLDESVVSVFRFMTSAQISDVRAETRLIDVSAAIQAAIDYSSSNNLSLRFPAGQYRVENTIHLPDDVSHPGKFVSLVGDDVSTMNDGTRAGPVIYSYAAILFDTKTTPTVGGLLRNVRAKIRGITFFANYVNNTNAICFNKIALQASNIQSCQFFGFEKLIVGTLNRVTHFHRNAVKAKIMLARDTNYTSISADSNISFNYINGMGSEPTPMTTAPVIDLINTGQMTVCNNYIDFCYNGVKVGAGGQNVIISENTFDLNFIPILMEYGGQPGSIINNNFFNISKTKVSLFTNPVAAMTTDDWICIKASNEYVANKVIRDNRYKVVDKFIRLGSKGNWNIREDGNSGEYTNSVSGAPTVDVIDFGTRVTDSATYPLDSKFLYLGSIENTVQNKILPKRQAYFGLNYRLGSPPVSVRVNDDWSLSDMSGNYTWGKINLLSSTNFASGWTFGTNVSQVGGVFTASNGSGWSYTNLALDPGTYVVCANITSFADSSKYIEFGFSLNTAPSAYIEAETSNLATSAGGRVNTAGRAFAIIKPTANTSRLAIYCNTGASCTIDYVHLIKIA